MAKDPQKQAEKLGETHRQLNQKGEMPRSRDGDAGMQDAVDVERAKRKP
jgi:hypothetical protein